MWVHRIKGRFLSSVWLGSVLSVGGETETKMSHRSGSPNVQETQPGNLQLEDAA
jgi:hypothetical protein